MDTRSPKHVLDKDMRIFLTIFLTITVIFMIGWIVAILATMGYVRQIDKIDIKTPLQQYLAELYKLERKPRLSSDAEVERMQRIVRDVLKKELPNVITLTSLRKSFFLFYVGGILLFFLVFVLLFHKTSVGAIITYIFRGGC